MAAEARRTLILLGTQTPDLQGSMLRYGDLLEQALRLVESDWTVRRVNLAPSLDELNKVPPPFRSMLHHWKVWRAARGLNPEDADVVHVLDGSHAYLTNVFSEFQTVVTSHDLIPYHQIQRGQGKAPSYPARWVISHSCKGLARADALVAVSARTRGDLIEALDLSPQRISVSHPPLAPQWFSASSRNPEGFVLHVGNDAFYKNRMGVVRIFSQMTVDPEIRLVLAGPPPSSELTTLVDQLGLTDRVHFRVDPSDEELAALYATAGLFLFPSLQEGYGWPPLEASAMGCPVVATDVGGIREVLGGEGPWYGASQEKELAALCSQVMLDPVLRAARVAQYGEAVKKLSLESTARNLLEIYDALSWSEENR